jgi:hypothetical protein
LRRLAENNFDFDIFLDNPIMAAGKKMHKEPKEEEASVLFPLRRRTRDPCPGSATAGQQRTKEDPGSMPGISAASEEDPETNTRDLRHVWGGGPGIHARDLCHI